MAEDTIKREDYAPITQELRVRLAFAALGLSSRMVEGLRAECDNIDAIHKALEEQNAKLRKEQKEWSIGATEAMAFVDRLTDAAEKREEVTILGVEYTALPLDADGVPIHVGDAMSHNRPNVMSPAPVDYMELWKSYETSGWTIRLDCGDAQAGFSGCELRHYHKSTVMDVLDELLMNWPDCEGPEDELALKQRCAKRLQLANREPLEAVDE